MKLSKHDVDLSSILSETARNVDMANRYINKVVEYQTDPDKVTRKKNAICKFCYYFGSKIGGAACCQRPCGLCDKDLHSGSTCVDVLCTSCAVNNSLCRECGGDLEMKRRRKFEK